SAPRARASSHAGLPLGGLGDRGGPHIGRKARPFRPLWLAPRGVARPGVTAPFMGPQPCVVDGGREWSSVLALRLHSFGVGRVIWTSPQDTPLWPSSTTFDHNSPGGPGRAQRAPRGNAGVIATEPQGFARPGWAYPPRPRRLPPRQTLGLLAVSRAHACL